MRDIVPKTSNSFLLQGHAAKYVRVVRIICGRLSALVEVPHLVVLLSTAMRRNSAENNSCRLERVCCVECHRPSTSQIRYPF